MLLKFRMSFLVVLLGCLASCGVPNPYNPNYENPFTGTLKNEDGDNIALASKFQDAIHDGYSESAAVVVVTDHFNVLIAGEVNSQAVKDKIGDMIKNNRAVKNYYDYTTIQAVKPTLHYNKTATKTAQLRVDNENNISQQNIKVVVVSSTAYVIGNIKPDQTKDLKSAIDGIYAVEGVNQVVNLTKIKSYDDTGLSF